MTRPIYVKELRITLEYTVPEVRDYNVAWPGTMHTFAIGIAAFSLVLMKLTMGSH